MRVRHGARPRRWSAAIAVALAAGLSGAVTPLSAQTERDFVFTAFGMDDGLAHGSVEAIVQDSAGFLWIGTHTGVDRFDGREFRAYRAHLGDTTSLRDDYVRALALAEGGRIWVGTESGGLSLLDPLRASVRNYDLAGLGSQAGVEGGAARGSRRVEGIALSASGVVVLVTDLGLAWLDPVTGRHGHLTHESPGRPVTLCRMASGEVAVSFSDGALERWNWTVPAGSIGDSVPGTRRLAALPVGAEALRCSEGVGGVLAGARDGRIFEVDPTHGTAHQVGRIPRAEAPRPFDVLRMPDGTIWIATLRGLWRLPVGSTEAYEVGGAGADRSIPHPEVRELFLDADGVLWIGTWNGLARLHPLQTTMRRVTVGPAGDGLRGRGVIGLERDARGRVWIGSDAGGVQLLEGDWRSDQLRVVPAAVPAELDEITVYDLAPDREGGMWIAAFVDGVLRATAGGRIVSVPVDGDAGAGAARAVYSVFVDRKGDVWAGSYALGLLRYQPSSGRFIPLLTPDERSRIGSSYAWPIAEDAGGTLWIGVQTAGLVELAPDRESFKVHRAGLNGLSDNRVISVFVDGRGMVWAGTEGGGLNRLDPETGQVKRYSVESGLPHDNVEAILEDDRGYLWVSTNNGLARLDPLTDGIIVFTEVAGLAGDRFFANAALRGPDGELYFGGPNGVTIVDPGAIERRESPPPVALTSFRIQGSDFPLARAMAPGGLDLEPDENFFTFEFAALDFVDPSQNRYRYRLEGLDPEWVEAGTDRVANYTSVPPDRYVFRVAARNSEGIWNEDGLSIPIRVQAPLHQTAWFRAGVLLLVAGLLFGLYSYRLQQLHKRQELRLEIAGRLHDDIGANLSTIALKAGMVGGGSSLDERARGHLADVARLARESAHKVRETVWVVNTRYDTVAGLVSKMKDTTDVLLEGHVSYSLEEPPQLPDTKIEMGVRQNVYLMFKEVLHNVVKHSGASTVTIRIDLVGPELRFTVRDDGVGFDTEAEGRGSGRGLLERRASLCRGSVCYDSSPSRGTAVEVRARLR